MVISVRAVYQDGQLRPLDPLDLANGQVVNLTIGVESAPDSMTADQIDHLLRAAGLLIDPADLEAGVELSDDERQRIGSLFVGERPSEDLIDEDRGTY